MSDEKPVLDPDASTPDLEALDSAWDEEEFDEDATMVAQIPKNLVALSRLKDPERAPPRDEAAPEKHEAITARPPPIAGAPAEPSVVVDAPHEQLADVAQKEAIEEAQEDDDDANDAAEGDEEARARAADEAAGLNAEERRKAADLRTAVRRDKARAKTLAARDRRKAKADVQRQNQKQKQKKKRSIPPPRGSDRPAPPDPQPTSRERPTIPPARDSSSPQDEAIVLPKQSWARMGIIVAIVVLVGALVIGLARN